MENTIPAPHPLDTRPPSLVLGVIGFDCHSVGNKILDAFFAEQGFQVTNLGVMVSQDEFISAAIETGADAILVSSLYGHGTIDCDGLRGRCIERGIGDVILYVGGNLVVGKTDAAEIERTFLAMGYDRVFRPDVDLEEAATLLRDDIDRRRAEKPSLATKGA
jgi:methylaspartate mutase sigma subunit